MFQVSLSFSFRIGRSTVCSILEEICHVIYNELRKDYVKVPSCANDWEGISKEFYHRWNFPHCLGDTIFYVVKKCSIFKIAGAIDSKHIVVQAPVNSGSLYYNYKGTHSIVLLAICDVYYRYICKFALLFLLVCATDLLYWTLDKLAGLVMVVYLTNSTFGELLMRGTLPFPLPQPLPGTSGSVVGDEAFPLRDNMLRPYPGRNLPGNQLLL